MLELIAVDYHTDTQVILALSAIRSIINLVVMAIEMLFGASSGALHAVTGPDHVLSLGPMAIGSRRSPWRLGARWGVGHALGTLLLCVPVLWLAQRAQLPLLASLGDRLAGVALLATAIVSFVQGRRLAGAGNEAGSAQSAVAVGFIHGLTGAASLLLVVPMLAGGSLPSSLVFLLAFAAGSTAGMAVLTSLLARVGSRLDPVVAQRARYVACAASAGLGLFWLLAR